MGQRFCLLLGRGEGWQRRRRPWLLFLLVLVVFVGFLGSDVSFDNFMSSAIAPFASNGYLNINVEAPLVCGVAAAQVTKPVEDTGSQKEKTSSEPLREKAESVKDSFGSEEFTKKADDSTELYVKNDVVEEQKDERFVVGAKKEGKKKSGEFDDSGLPELLTHDGATAAASDSNEVRNLYVSSGDGKTDNMSSGKNMKKQSSYSVERNDKASKLGLNDKILEGVSQFATSSSMLFAELSRLYDLAMRSIYEEGNITAAIEWLEKGALLGHGRMHWLLGVLYANGVGVEQSDAKAILHYTFAALDSVPEAHLALGRRYADGIGVAKSCENAVGHYREVADAVAMTHDAVLNPMQSFYGPFEMDASRIHDKDGEAKLTVLMFNADAGVTEAIMSLGYIYFMGKHGVRRDWHRARDYFHMALDKGEVAAYGALGQLYVSGDPTALPAIERDIETALTYFSKGAKLNDPVSLNGMGYLYAIGLLVDDKLDMSMGRPDFVKAAKFFKESAERGSTEGMYNFGVLLLYGRGVPQNSLAAVRQFEAAALRGSLLSFWRLARHEHIKGNCARALFFYDRVSSFGSMFDRNSDTPFFLSGKGQNSFPSGSSQPPIVPRENNDFAELLEALALAETGHAPSRCHAAKVADALEPVEEAKETLDDDVFVKNNHQSVQQGKTLMENGAVWLRWFHSATLSNFEEISLSPAATLPQMRLLSQREAFNMLRLRLYSFCSLSGSSEANLWLGDFFYYGKSRLFDASMSQAFLHYELAAQKKNPKALFNLGFMYQLGLGVPTGGRAKSVGDAIYRILTNAPLGIDDDGGEEDGAINTTTTFTAQKGSMPGFSNAITPEEMRLYLAKRYYDNVIEVGSPGCVYVARLALMSLNFQWWWWYFSRKKYGLFQTLRLSLPMARVRDTRRVAQTTSLLPPEQQKQEEPVIVAQTVLAEGNYDWSLWDDCVLFCSAALMFLLLLVRHHGA